MGLVSELKNVLGKFGFPDEAVEAPKVETVLDEALDEPKSEVKATKVIQEEPVAEEKIETKVEETEVEQKVETKPEKVEVNAGRPASAGAGADFSNLNAWSHKDIITAWNEGSLQQYLNTQTWV